MSYSYDRWERSVQRWALEASQAMDAGHGDIVERIRRQYPGNSYQINEKATWELRKALELVTDRHDLAD